MGVPQVHLIAFPLRNLKRARAQQWKKRDEKKTARLGSVVENRQTFCCRPKSNRNCEQRELGDDGRSNFGVQQEPESATEAAAADAQTTMRRRHFSPRDVIDIALLRVYKWDEDEYTSLRAICVRLVARLLKIGERIIQSFLAHNVLGTLRIASSLFYK